MTLPLTTSLPPGGIDWRSLAIAFAFAALALFLNTHSNQFPSAYHPDEPSKARQVIEGEFNFHHPMLMLTTTRLLLVGAGDPTDVEQVTIAGRWASALFTSAAIFCLTLLAALLGGSLAAGIAGALLATNHQLFELAHYFKEDPALLFGLSAFFLCLVLFDRRPGLGMAALLGASVGLALSGKYVGGVAAPIALGFLLARRERPGLTIPLCLATAATVFAVINLPAFLHFGGFAEGFGRELDFAVRGHKGITRSVPHGVYGAVFRESTNPVIWVLLGFYAMGLWLRFRTVKASEWIVALFPLAFALMLSFSPKTHHRYFLPATGILLTLAALGTVTFARARWKGHPLLPRVPRTAVALLLLGIALAVQLPTTWAYFSGFGHDGRSALAAWLVEHVPAGRTIVIDKRVNLRALNLPYEFEGKLFAADVGTIDELRQRGVEYVGVAEGDYGRFFREKLRPTDDGAEEFNRRRSFYEQLFEEGELVFECEPGTLQYLQPHLKLYRLPPKP